MLVRYEYDNKNKYSTTKKKKLLGLSNKQRSQTSKFPTVQERTMKLSLLQILLLVAITKLSNGFAPGVIRSTSTQLFATSSDYDEQIASHTAFLCKASVTKCEDPEQVLNSLESLEKLMRQKRKAEGEGVAQDVLDNLTGEWRLVFTTGTKKTQDRSGKINYFPLKAIQAFDATKDPMYIENAIYVGDFALIKFRGDFEFDLKKSKVEFDFDQICILGFTINLKKDTAAKVSTVLDAFMHVRMQHNEQF